MTVDYGDEEENDNNLDGHPITEAGEEAGDDDVHIAGSHLAAAQAMPATSSPLSTSGSNSPVRFTSAGWEELQSDEGELLPTQPEG